MMNDNLQYNETAFQHGWEWFRYHADQRLALFRFYIILTGAIATAHVTALYYKLPIAAIGTAVFGVVVSICFYCLDQRSGQLVKLGESVLDKEQKRLEQSVGYGEIRIIKESNIGQKQLLGSYRRAFRLLFLTSFSVFVFEFVRLFFEIA